MSITKTSNMKHEGSTIENSALLTILWVRQIESVMD